MTEQPQATKRCEGPCGLERPIGQFPARRKTCQACLDTEREAKRAKVAAKREAATYSDGLGEKIVDCLASGMTIAEICEQSWAPTRRQLRSWRRENSSFSEACDLAIIDRADVRSDRVDEALRDMKAGTISHQECRQIVETELKLAALENPGKYGPKVVSDITLRQGAPVEKFDTEAWVDRVLNVPPPRAGNIIELKPLPAPSKEPDREAS